MENIKYAVFDMDGTLLDSMHIWDTVAEAFLMMNGIVPEHHNIFRKTGYLEGINFLIKTYNLNMTYDEIKGHIEKILEYYYSNVATAKPGVKEFLERLKKSGAMITVATATDRQFVEAALKRNDLLEYIDRIFTTREVGKRKDFPDIFDACKKFMNADKNSLYIFEDALYAIQTCKNAGYNVCCIEDYSMADDRDKLKELSDYYVKDYFEIYNIFDI